MIKLLSNAWKLLTSVRDSRGTRGKGWYRSRTLWVNFFALIGVISATYFKVEFNAELTVGFMAVVNYILRLITNEPTGFID